MWRFKKDRNVHGLIEFGVDESGILGDRVYLERPWKDGGGTSSISHNKHHFDVIPELCRRVEELESWRDRVQKEEKEKLENELLGRLRPEDLEVVAELRGLNNHEICDS